MNVPQCYIIHMLPVLFSFGGRGDQHFHYRINLMPLEDFIKLTFCVCMQLHLRLQDPCVVWFKKIFEFKMFLAPCLWMTYIFWTVKTKGQNCLCVSSDFRNISRDVRVFSDRDFLLSQVMNHVCVVWLLTREILGSNLALVISFWVISLWVFFGLTRQMPELYFKLGCKCFFSHPCGICRPQGERIWHLSWNISLVFFLLSSNRRSCAVGCKSFISNCLHFQTFSAA